MIVSDDNISTALKYLAQDPHPVALARKDVLDCENACKAMFAKLFLEGTGSVKERECYVEDAQVYQQLKAEEAEAIFELERHKARTRAADMLIETWRSEQANARIAEKVR